LKGGERAVGRVEKGCVAEGEQKRRTPAGGRVHDNGREREEGRLGRPKRKTCVAITRAMTTGRVQPGKKVLLGEEEKRERKGELTPRRKDSRRRTTTLCTPPDEESRAGRHPLLEASGRSASRGKGRGTRRSCRDRQGFSEKLGDGQRGGRKSFVVREGGQNARGEPFFLKRMNRLSFSN